MARGCLQFTHSGSQTMMHPKIPSRSTRARCPVVEEARAQHPSDWAAILAIAPKIGCNPETLRAWYRELRRGEARIWAWNGIWTICLPSRRPLSWACATPPICWMDALPT